MGRRKGSKTGSSCHYYSCQSLLKKEKLKRKKPFDLPQPNHYTLEREKLLHKIFEEFYLVPKLPSYKQSITNSTSSSTLASLSLSKSPLFYATQQSGARLGVFFLRFIKPADISDIRGNIGRQADKLLRFFLTISVVAVQASVLQPTPPYPPELEDVRFDAAGSSTESGVIKPSSEPDSGKDKNLQSKRKLESPPTPFVLTIQSIYKETA